jgi:superfamily I DNA and/or RNA helicase
MYESRQRHADNFSTFARIFNSPASSKPTLTLTEQYRMDATISGLVGDNFYAESGGLHAMRERADHPLDAPAVLGSSRLVWIDTGLASRSIPHWANEFEGDICATAVRAMRPEPGRPGGPSLAVLTPYRNQVEVLRKKMSEHHAQIFTVDGYQGREADIVVASLVRDRIRTDSGPIGNVGHLAVPNRINVMLSRARELLVLVGRIDLYENHAGPAWSSVVARFRRDGMIVTPEDWIG